MHKWQAPSRAGLDGRKAGKCVSLLTGEVITRKTLRLKQDGQASTPKGDK